VEEEPLIGHPLQLPVACPAVQYFSTLPPKWHDFRKNNFTEHELRVLIFYENFVLNISHSMKNLATHYHKRTQVFM